MNFSLGSFLSAIAGASAIIAGWNAAILLRRRRHPQPLPDQAICYKCDVVGGGNLILEADEATDHLRAHVICFPGRPVNISAKWAITRDHQETP